jgi:hypothetical protein
MISNKYSGYSSKEDLEFSINNKHPDFSYDLFNSITKLISNKLLTEKEFVFDNVKYNLITIHDNNFLYETTELIHFYPNFISNGNSFQLSENNYDDYVVCLKSNDTLNFEYSLLNDDNTVSIYYMVVNICDLLKSMHFLNKFDLSDNDTVKIEIFCKKKYLIGIFNNKNLYEQINFTDFYNILLNIDAHNYFIITVNEKYLNNFLKLNINFENIYANSQFRKKLHKNYPFNITPIYKNN